MQQTTLKPDNIATIEDFLTWAAGYFNENNIYFGHGTDNAWDEAVMLVLYVLKLPAENDRSLLVQKLTAKQKQQLVALALQRVAEQIPVPYLTHEAWFAGERYIVNREVLIPRSPLGETIGNHFQPWLGNTEPQRILDLCTGSGCLAIYCAKMFERCQVDAVDISPAVLKVAKQNVELHQCADRVHPIESDLFSAVAGRRYDIIISNPPYVSAEEMAALPAEYRHEPVLALASGEDGLDLTRKIINQAKHYLTDTGLLIVEVGDSWLTLEEKYPHIPFTWLDFSYGGEGVFLLTVADLKALQQELK
jgi:ribosomal protein L3 glutamine methyltransferase